MRILYLLIIALSNILTAKFNPFVLCDGLLIIPVGSLLAGATFVMRDIVQLKNGKSKTYTTILVAVLLSGVISISVGDTAYIALASAVAFFVSEAIDTEIYSRIKKSFACRVLLSGIIGGFIDSTLFVMVGLSPVGAGMLSWDQVPLAIIGQVVAKSSVQLSAAGVILSKTKREEFHLWQK